MYEEQILLIPFAVISVKLDDDVYHDLLEAGHCSLHCDGEVLKYLLIDDQR